MKHLFLIHSEIVRRISVAYQADHLMDASTILVAYRRSVGQVSRHKSFDINDWVLSGFSFPAKLLYFFRTIALRSVEISRVDSEVNKQVAGEQFVFYTPNPWDEVSQLIISNDLCVNYYIIEEGLLSYQPYGSWLSISIWWKEYFRSFLNMITTLGRLKFAPYFRYLNLSKYSGVISVSQESFPGYPKNKVVCQIDWTDTSLFDKKIKHLFILENLSRFIDDSLYIKIIFDFISKIPKNERQYIRFKFHPGHLNDFRVNFKKIAFLEIGYSPDLFLSDAVFVEGIGLGSNVTSYYSISSAGMYISMMGGKVICFRSTLCDASKKFRHHFKGSFL